MTLLWSKARARASENDRDRHHRPPPLLLRSKTTSQPLSIVDVWGSRAWGTTLRKNLLNWVLLLANVALVVRVYWLMSSKTAAMAPGELQQTSSALTRIRQHQFQQSRSPNSDDKMSFNTTALLNIKFTKQRNLQAPARSCASFSCSDQDCWAVTTTDRQLWHRGHGDPSWQQQASATNVTFAKVAVSGNGQHVYAVTVGGEVWYRHFGNSGKDDPPLTDTSWKQMDWHERLAALSVNIPGSTLVGIEKRTGEVLIKQQQQRHNDGTWRSLGGHLATVAMTDDGRHVYGVNQAGELWRAYLGKGVAKSKWQQWQQLPPTTTGDNVKLQSVALSQYDETNTGGKHTTVTVVYVISSDGKLWWSDGKDDNTDPATLWHPVPLNTGVSLQHIAVRRNHNLRHHQWMAFAADDSGLMREAVFQ